MDTPICDFVMKYTHSGSLRLHMPGHKGKEILGFEHRDITEINGADSLYEATGIIRKSEENASALFGCRTYYSTEGASHCIRAMLYLATLQARRLGRKPLIFACRNAHKSFLSAAALLDLDVTWLYPNEEESYLSCNLDAQKFSDMLSTASQLPVAVYLTSPDYLGRLADITGIARVCHQYGVMLLVDNAHGAYLKFLPQSLHPIDLGADICCDSAHKTLPVLTGGAYLHISQQVPQDISVQVKNAFALFGSTSPSYLILQSLDAANLYLSSYSQTLQAFLDEVNCLKRRLKKRGYCLYGDEPLKLTIATKSYGYTGIELSEILLLRNIVCEFADPDYIVFMLTSEIGREGLQILENALLSVPAREPILLRPPYFEKAERVLSVRQAVFAPSEKIPVENCDGRVLASASISCPPAVPILVCGERIDKNAIDCFRYYGIDSCWVVDHDQI